MLFNCIYYVALNDKIMFRSDEVVWVWKETVLAYIRILYHLLGIDVERHERPHTELQISWKRFESWAFRYEAKMLIIRS
jgi:hypothetical protein